MATDQKQSLNLRPGKRFSGGLSNENLRIGSSSAWSAGIAGTLDPTRIRLDFEVGKGGVIKDIDKSVSVPKRIQKILDDNGIVDPNIKLTDEQLAKKKCGTRTYASFILQGSHDTMVNLAFGDQKISFEPNADNSHLRREEGIEKWAKDMYNFVANKYGEHNIAEFVVHVDETTPHAHCVVVPIDQNGKLSFKNVFLGGVDSKEAFSNETKKIWDEAAVVAEKYGMARGDDSLTTGAQYKSYYQWLREQIAQGRKIIDDQDSTIRSQAATIEQQADILSNQKLRLYAINDEIKKAEKKQKGLSTMIENLEKQKEYAEIELMSLNDEKDMTEQELEKKRKECEKKIVEIELKIADKEKKLSVAEGQLYDLAKRKIEIQQKLDELRREYNKEIKGDILDKTQREVDSTMWRIAAEEMVQEYPSIKGFGNRLPYDLRTQYNETLEGTFFKDLCERGLQIAGVAAALYLGMTDAAGNFARQNGGGGGSPGSDWGRDKDEDDEAFRRRCCIMGRMMMQPPGRKLKR